jgi:hypothetical protein
MSTKTRKVKRRNGKVNLTKGKVRRSRPSKEAILAATRKLNRTRTRRFIVYAIICIISMQVIRYVLYNFIYVGSTTPTGLAFTIIIYVQTGLMLASLGFIVAASIAYLNSLRD